MLDPEKINPAIRDYIAQEYRRGLTTEGCMGLHGTSLETLQYVLANGVLPGRIKNYRKYEEQGEVFYTPLRKAGIITSEDKQMGAWYAHKNATRHYLSTQLELDLQKPQSHVIVDRLINHTSIPFKDDPKFQELFRKKGWDPIKIQKLVALAEEQQGIIIGIRTKVSNTYETSETDRLGYRNDGPRIITHGKGLPFTSIIGILPLGDRERQFLDKL